MSINSTTLKLPEYSFKFRCGSMLERRWLKILMLKSYSLCLKVEYIIRGYGPTQTWKHPSYFLSRIEVHLAQLLADEVAPVSQVCSDVLDVACQSPRLQKVEQAHWRENDWVAWDRPDAFPYTSNRDVHVMSTFALWNSRPFRKKTLMLHEARSLFQQDRWRTSDCQSDRFVEIQGGLVRLYYAAHAASRGVGIQTMGTDAHRWLFGGVRTHEELMRP